MSETNTNVNTGLNNRTIVHVTLNKITETSSPIIRVGLIVETAIQLVDNLRRNVGYYCGDLARVRNFILGV